MSEDKIINMEEGKFRKWLTNTTSVIQSRLAIAGQLGKQFGGNRDLYQIFGYSRDLTYDQFRARYERDSIAGRVVEAPADATWRHAPILTDDPLKPFEISDQIRAINETWLQIEKRVSGRLALHRADQLAGMGRYSLLLIGTRDGRDLRRPARQNLSPEDILYMTPYSEKSVEIREYESNPRSERFGKPVMYEITMNGDINTDARISQQKLLVHWSRVIHVAENLLENEIFGEPRLKRVYNLFDDLAKVCGGGAEIFWLIGNRGVSATMDPEANLDSDIQNRMQEEIDNYVNGLSRSLLLQGVDVKPLGADNADPSSIFNMVISLISGATGIPQRILLGSERGELASSQDRANWDDRIRERQQNFAEPVMFRPLMTRLMEYGALPQIDGFNVYWPEHKVASDNERAEVAARMAQAVASLANQRSKIVVPSEFREKYLGLPPEIPDEDIEMIVDVNSPAPSAGDDSIQPRDDPNDKENKG